MKKILIVEADPDTRFLLNHALSKEFSVEFLHDSKELSVYLSDTDMLIINTVLLDTTLYNLCSKLRADLEAGIPILAITASVDAEKMKGDFPADSLLFRPFTNHQLKEVIDNLFNKRNANS